MNEPLWGRETERAIENFRISGEPMPHAVVRWLATVKALAARVNADLGVIDDALAQRIAAAADEIASGAHRDQFPVDVFQTGSGTSTNMNVNEVISTLTDGLAHPNDHVNLGQSSNDTIPTAVQLAACAAITTDLLPAIGRLTVALDDLGAAHPETVRPGRTHLMDAVPVLFADTVGGWVGQLEEAAEQIGAARLPLSRLPLGGTAVGNGLGAHPELAARIVAELSHDPRLGVPPSVATHRVARQGAHDALVAASGTLVVLATALTKIANDLRWMASGPTSGLAEIALPELQKGSSIMPGKVNPVVPEVVLQVAAQVIGNHTTVTVAGMQGNFELNVMVPVMARNLLQSIALSAAACTSLAARLRRRRRGARRPHARAGGTQPGARDGAERSARIRPRRAHRACLGSDRPFDSRRGDRGRSRSG